MKTKVSVGYHIAVALAFLSGMLCAASLPTPRLVPVDPLLSDVDAQSGQMTFYYVGALAGGAAADAHTVVATVDGGSAARTKLGEDRRATVTFGALAAGTHDIEVALSAPDGATLCRHHYGIMARTKRAKAVGRRLNNFVTEILDTPLTDGEVAFENPREGWVFIGFDRPYAATKAYLDGGKDPVVVFRPDEPSETMRWLKEGRHSLRIEGVEEKPARSASAPYHAGGAGGRARPRWRVGGWPSGSSNRSRSRRVRSRRRRRT